MRFSFSSCAAAVVVVGLTATASATTPVSGTLSVEAMHKGPDPGRGSWSLVLDDAGNLTVNVISGERRFRLSQRQLRDFSELVKRERFFGLRDEYGVGAVSGEFRVIDVSLAGRRKKIVLLDGLADAAHRDEIKRALLVWEAVRSLFDIPQALDSREEDRALIRQLFP